MPPDCYKVEVIHFLNPHLIWTEVRDPLVAKDEYSFEQIGIYGILPLDITLDVDSEDLKSRVCENWQPAATKVMKEVFAESTDIWFSPTHIHRRSSIFDDNIHKYGELLINKGGKTRKLSKLLIKSGFAYYNECHFHESLSNGKIKTKLNSLKTREVIKELENCYIRKDVPKNHWEKSVKNQTSIFHISQNLESELTVTNLEKHNNKLLQNKMNDLELCKGIEEESLGRGYTKSKVEYQVATPSPQNKSVTKENIDNVRKEDPKNMYKDIKMFLETDSKIKESDTKEYVVNTESNENNKVTGKENLFLSKKTKYFNKHGTATMNGNVTKQHNNEKITEEMSKVVQRLYEVDNYALKTDISIRKQNLDRYKENESEITMKTKKPKKTTKSVDSEFVYKKQLAYGPPGLDRKFYKLQAMPNPDDDEEIPEIHKEDIEENVEDKTQDTLFGEVDSEIDIDISNKSRLKEYFKEINSTINKKDSIKDVIVTENRPKPNSKVNDNCEERNFNYDSSGRNTSASSSLLLRKKLRAHVNVSRHNNSFSSSDTSVKDSSSVSDVQIHTKKVTNNDDDEDIDEIIEKLNVKYSDTPNKIKEEPIATKPDVNKLVNNVNPFKNLDANISVFVDKLVSPVLMVHSKINRRIEPVFEMRDVYFNSHIHIVLKNMSIERPMMLQTISWPIILRGLSLFMISPLGSGKTLGYLPAVCRLISDSNSEIVDSVGPVCIIVCATAKSVADVERMAKMFLGLEDRVLSCYAGVDNLYITQKLLNGCDLLICTPSSLVRLLQLNDFGVDLRRLSMFVLDDCERLADTYSDELKFFQYKIKEMLKIRANKELKVQHILASRVWCDFMEPLAKKAPDTVVCIGAFQECVLYSKTNTSVTLVKSENKLDSVYEFLKEIDTSKKTVIVCKENDEVEMLEKALKRSKHVVFACNNNMTVHDLYNLSVAWSDYDEPLYGPILICCDGNLTHMNITDAHNLIHFSLPHLFSMFCKRFSVLNDNYPSIFKSNDQSVKVKIILGESNVEQLPKIVNFIKRCSDNVPKSLNEICENVLADKDLAKAQNYVPLCDNLLSLGDCPDFYNCKERHAIFKHYDKPKDWLPKEGLITFKIIHFHSAVFYSARLLSKTVNGVTTKFPDTYNNLSMKLGMYYSKESNRKLHGIPNVGDICAASMKLNLFVRCQVIKILSKYQRGNPNNVLVKLIDEEKYEISRDIYLYHLPDELKAIETCVVQVRLGNIEPKDKDITFSDLARDQLKNMVEGEKELFVRGQISLILGNCIFVNTLEACQELISLNETVVKHNLKRELLENHAIPSPDHLTKIEKLCIDSGLLIKHEVKVKNTTTPIKNLPKGTWAHLEKDTMSSVFFASALSPDKFFVRLDKFESCMSSLLKDIKKYVEGSNDSLVNVKEGELVLAQSPEDSMYERVRIDGISGNKARCFFVDQGDWNYVPLSNIKPITEQLINQLPFQAIECRLIGVKPPGEEWTDFSTNWFCDNCYEDKNGDLKHLFVKYFSKESAEFTAGHKYVVALIDTNTDQDVIINQLMIDLNLAQENGSEIEILNNMDINKNEAEIKQLLDDDDDWERVSQISDKREVMSDESEESQASQKNVMLQKPLRSIPLVPSDDDLDEFDRWDVNINEDTAALFLPAFKKDQTVSIKEVEEPKESGTRVIPEIPKMCQTNKKPIDIQELDSDDLTSPDSTDVSKTSPIKHKPLPPIDPKRKPKLVWRQNKNSVSVKIELIGVESYKLDVKERQLIFKAVANETEYEFDIELYGVIDKDKASHENKGQYILVKLTKVLNKNWLTLTRDGGIKKWIVYDVDSIDTSSDEEEIDKSTFINIVKNIHNKDGSESEDDDFVDDIHCTYNREY